MHVFEMIALITIATLVAGLIREWIRSKQALTVEISDLEKRLAVIEPLKKRIEVLEAIVTDKGYDLKGEINRL